MKQTITAIALHRPDESPVFGANATRVSLDDAGAGLFIVIEQSGEDEDMQGKLSFDIMELREVLRVAEILAGQCGV